MKPAPFTYHAPATIEEAARLISELEMPKLLAGGQSLMPMLNMRYVFADNIIDLNRVADLDGVTLSNGRLEIGAMTRQRTLQRDPVILEHMPILPEALRWTGHVATRSRGTIGGSLSHLDPAAELPAILALHDGILVAHSLRGSRNIAAKDWFQGYMAPALEPDEILVQIKLPVWDKPQGHSFLEIARRHGDFAIAGAGALMEFNPSGELTRIAIVVFGSEVSPVRVIEAEQMLLGQKPSDDHCKAASEFANQLDCMEDVHFSADYRRHISAVLVRRALKQAAERAGVAT